MTGGAPVTELLAQIARAQARAEHHKTEAEQVVTEHESKVDNGHANIGAARRTESNGNPTR